MVRIDQYSIPACGIQDALGLLFRCIVTGWLAFAPSSPLAAETKKKTAGDETGASAPKKKSQTKAAPKPDSDKKDAATTGTGAKSKSKAVKPKPATGSDDSDSKPGPARPADSATTPNAAIAPDELVEFHEQPAGVKKLIESSLELARKNLTYTYGSSDPTTGGLDCSGFIYFVLRQNGFSKVPRDSSGQYSWVRRAGTFRAVVSRKPDSFELGELRPGDLLFWTGTYATTRDPPITHVMLYLGTEKFTGAKVMIGSSDGRPYRGQKRNGVSVFDFLLPRVSIVGDQRATFIGYGRIPED